MDLDLRAVHITRYNIQEILKGTNMLAQLELGSRSSCRVSVELVNPSPAGTQTALFLHGVCRCT